MKESSNKNCAEIVGRLADYSVGRGSARLRREIEDHIASCPNCAHELEVLIRTATLIEETIPADAPDLWNAIASRLQTKPTHLKTTSPILWVARHKLHSAVTGGLVLITLGALIFSNIQKAPEIGSSTYFSHHATMSLAEPFADKAALGLLSLIESKQE